MSLREKVLEEGKSGGGVVTFPQGKFLYQLTKLKWWQPEVLPAPTCRQASLIIDACLLYTKSKSKQEGRELIEAIQLWFPSFNDISEVHARYFPKDHNGNEPEPTPEPESKARSGGRPASAKGSKTSKINAKSNTPAPPVKRSHHKNSEKTAPKPGKRSQPKKTMPEPQPEREPRPEKRPIPRPETQPDKYTEEIKALIGAGLINIWLVGPAGCGKTTICKEVGDLLDMPVTVIPCGAGTSATTFLGYSYPTREATPFVLAYQQEGIIVLDEFTALEATVAQIANAALGNNELSSKIGTFKRHERCIIIATSNTFGMGADRMYVSNNQLDAATNDRFKGGILELDYSKEYESQYDNEVTRYVWAMRETIRKNGLRKLASTRAIIVGCKLKTAGLNWKTALTTDWTKDEKALLQ